MKDSQFWRAGVTGTIDGVRSCSHVRRFDIAQSKYYDNRRVAPVCTVSIVDDLQGGARFGSCMYVLFLSKVLFLEANFETKGRF